jgi:hypothetical protein
MLGGPARSVFDRPSFWQQLQALARDFREEGDDLKSGRQSGA